MTGLAYAHQRVRRVRRLLAKRSTRWVERAFVAEGAESLRAALDAGAEVESVYRDPARAADHGTVALLEQAQQRGARCYDLAPGVLERVADTVTPQPVLAVLPMLDRPLDVLDGTGLWMVCADVRDPGNAGTVLRSADASGAAGVVFAGTTVDPFNPKTVRSSAGSIFQVPVVVVPDTSWLLSRLGELSYRRLGSVVRGGRDYLEVDWSVPTALVLGNEAAGLGDDVLGRLDGTVGIPMAGRTESLNVGMACAVLCFEALRQRRAAEEPASVIEASTMQGR